MVSQWNEINANYKSLEGYKRVAWPPASEERVVREFTPQPYSQFEHVPSDIPQSQHQQQHLPTHTSNQQHQVPQQYSPQAQNQYQYQPQQYQAPYQQPQQQLQYQQPQQQPHEPHLYQHPHWVQQQHLPQPYKPPTQQDQYQTQQQQHQAPSYQLPQHYEQEQSKNQALLNKQFQAPHQQHQAQPQNQFVTQPNQQFNSYSQPQPQTVSHDQTDKLIQQHQHDQRGASPGIITLRKEAPVSQVPAPVYTSQPAAVSYQGGSNMRGDLKWPPPECKEAMARENEERRQLALGPVCRPRKVKRDYTPFFAKNALSHHYPSYKVPPGTQHMTE